MKIDGSFATVEMASTHESKGSEQLSQEQRDFLRQIGVNSTQSHIKAIDRRSTRLREHHRIGVDDKAIAARALCRSARAVALAKEDILQHRGTRYSAVAALTPAGTSRLPREDFEKISRELAKRTQELRNMKLDDWKNKYKVVVECRGDDLYHRPHYHLTIPSTEDKLNGMPRHELCINKNSRKTMLNIQENLFRRRLKLDIQEKKLDELDKIRRRNHIQSDSDDDLHLHQNSVRGTRGTRDTNQVRGPETDLPPIPRVGSPESGES